MTIDYEKELNLQQRAAVFHEKGPALVLAGAGTGKTRTLVYRVAHLLETGVRPQELLLLTFTRRASQEMLTRARELAHIEGTERISGGTFHSLAHVILRQNGRSLGLSPRFTVLDRSDAEDVLQHLRTELGYAEPKGKVDRFRSKRFPQKRALMEIFSKTANMAMPLQEIIERDWPQFLDDADRITTLKEHYTAYKQKRGLLDYDDLLLLTLRLLREHAAQRERIAERFRHILVDEYQDTNRTQAEMLKYLTSRGTLMAVGDDAQAIYSFRGADVRNILSFPKDFPGTTVYRIEENYRSTQPILAAANAVMARAATGYTKTLFTERTTDMKAPKLLGCADEAAQASYITDEVLRLREEGVSLSDIAVLFRSSYHSFQLEAELAHRNIPFVKYGGFKFAEAAHIKDALAHLRWLVNPHDLVAAQRCLLLLQGIGPVTARSIAEHAAFEPKLSEGIEKIARSVRNQTALLLLQQAIQAAASHETPSTQLAALLPYLKQSIAQRFDDAPKRMRDLEHLIAIARRFRSTERFVSDFSIDPPADHMVTGVVGNTKDEKPLVLSTIHSAKGLEWHSVFILSVLDGYLPLDYAFRSDAELEEERRLLYVAMTRAKEHLTLLYPSLIAPGEMRGEMIFTKPSHFVEGIPDEVLSHTVLADSTLFDNFAYEEE